MHTYVNYQHLMIRASFCYFILYLFIYYFQMKFSRAIYIKNISIVLALVTSERFNEDDEYWCLSRSWWYWEICIGMFIYFFYIVRFLYIKLIKLHYIRSGILIQTSQNGPIFCRNLSTKCSVFRTMFYIMNYYQWSQDFLP